MRFIMQIKIRPPTFYLYVNDKNLVSVQFMKYI